MGLVSRLFDYIEHAEKKNISEKKITFNEFVNALSDMSDKFMLDNGDKLNITYVGGDCTITRKNTAPEMISVEIIIYGKVKEEDGWKVSTITKEREIQFFTTDNDTALALDKLKKEPLKFKIEPPKKEK